MTLVFAPWAFGTTEAWSIRALEVLCLLTVAVVFGERAWAGELQVRRPRIMILGALVLVLVGVQLLNPVVLKVIVRRSVYELVGGNPMIPFTIRHDASMAMGFRWLCILLFALAVMQHLRSREDVVWLIRMMVINITLVALIGILVRLSGSWLLMGIRKVNYAGTFGPYVCKNNFASLANLAVPLAMGLAFLPEMIRMKGDESKTPQRFFWGFCAAILVAAVVQSASRMGAIVSLFVTVWMLLDIILRRRGSGSVLSVWALVAVVVGIAILVPFVGGAVKLWERFAGTSAYEPSRVEVWKGVWMAIQHSPRWGYGLGTFQYLFPFYQPDDLRNLYRQAHSDWLEAVFDFGWFGFVLVALFMGAIVWTLARERIRKTSTFRRSVAGCVLASVAGCLLHALVDFPLHIASLQITFFTVAALGLAAAYASPGET